MEYLNLTIPQFKKLMRQYSESTLGQECPIDSAKWRPLKRELATNKRLTTAYVSKSEIIIYEALGSVITIDAHSTKNAELFIDFIFHHVPYEVKNNMIDYNTITSYYSDSTTNCVQPVTWQITDYLTKEEYYADKQKEKEKEKMNFNFDFGKVTTDLIRMSMYGIAVKAVDGRYVAYDAENHSVMDVDIMNMPCGDFLYKMPIAIKDVKAGDVVVHNKTPMFVVEVHESTLKVVDIREGTEKEIYLTKSPFGFNFATKVVSLMDMTGGKADESNPFGNMLPFMLMGDNKDFDPMMLMLMNSGKMDTSNPMMMYFLMKDTNHKDMLPLLMMMNAKD